MIDELLRSLWKHQVVLTLVLQRGLPTLRQHEESGHWHRKIAKEVHTFAKFEVRGANTPL
jgi:hypothetical protein